MIPLQEKNERSVAALPLLSGKLLAQLRKSWRLLKDQFPEYKFEENEKNIMIHMSENPMNKGRHVETGIFSALKKIKTDARDQKNNVKSMLKQI